MAHLNMQQLEAEMLPILVKTFPRVFFPSGRDCRPLRVGIFEDLDAALPAEIDRARLKAFLGLYTGQPRYLRELKPGVVRIGLNGRTAGRVSLKEAASAAARLKKLNGVGTEPPAADSRISSAPMRATPREGEINPSRTPFSLPRQKGAQTGLQKNVIVVVKKRKGAFGKSAPQVFRAVSG